MLRLRIKQFLALFLCGLLTYPLPVVAESAEKAPPDTVLESAAPSAIVGIGEVSVPHLGLLFSEEEGKTGVERALSQYPDGLRVGLGMKSVTTPGLQVASMRTGAARAFGEASAPAAIPPSPQVGGGTGTNRGWLLALGVAIAGTALAIAALVRANEANDRTH